MPKRLRKLLLAFGSLLLLAVVSVGVISTPWAQQYLQRWAIAKLEAATGTRIEIREFHFRPLILQFIFRGLVLHGKEPSNSPALFSAETVVIELSLATVMRGRLSLRSVDWDGVEIRLLTLPDGSTNLPEPAASLRGANRVVADFSIGRLSLSRTNIFWDQQEQHIDLNARDVAILARRVSRGRYVGSLSTQGLRFQSNSPTFPPAAVTARFELSASGLELSPLTWQCAGIRGTGKLTLTDWRSFRVSFSYQATANVKELSRDLHTPWLRGGRLESQGQIAYAKGEFKGQGHLLAREIEIESSGSKVNGIHLASDYSLDGLRIRLSNLTGSGLGGSAHGSGEMSLDGSPPQVRLQCRLQGLDLPRVIASLTKPRKTARFFQPASRASGTIDMSWQGNFEDFQSLFDIHFEPQPGGGASVFPLGGHARGALRLNPDLILDIEEATLQTPASNLSAQGTVGLHQVSLAVQFATRSFDEWQPVIASLTGSAESVPLKLNSEVTFRGGVSGPIQGPEIRGRLDSGPMEYRGWKWHALIADVIATPNRFEVSSARLEHMGTALTLAGRLPLKEWRVDPGGPIQFTVRAEQAHVEGLASALGLGIPLHGSISGNLDLHGTPSDVSGQGYLQVKNGSLSGEPFDLLSADLRVAHSVGRFENLRLAKGRGLAQGQAEIVLQTGTFQADLNGTNFQLTDFRRITAALAPASPSDLQGVGSFDLHASGRTGDLTLSVNATVRKIVVRGEPVGDLQARIIWMGQQISVEGKAEGPGGTLNLSASGESIGDWPLHLTGNYSSFHIEPWVRLFSAGESGPHLSVAGTLEAELPLKKPDHLEVQLQAQSLEIAYPKLTWKNAGPVNVHYSRRRFAVDRFRLKGPATDLTIEGAILFDQGRALSLSVEGNAEATLLSLIDPALEANGNSTLKLRIAGSLQHPTFNGALHVKDVSVSYGDLPFRITALEGEIGLEGERATLRSLRGMSGGGAVTLNGFVIFGNVPRFNVQANLSQVRVRYPSDFTSLLDGTLRLAGNAERGQIGGELTVRQLFPAVNMNWLARAGELAGPASSKGPAIASPFAPRIRLNVQLGSSPAVRFEARDLRLVADIDMRLQGTLANPVAVGTIQILSGEAVFRGNRYIVQRGDISMTNPFRTQPILGLEARTRIQRYDLTVTISGPFDRLKINYRSDPPLPAEDIVTLLAFGYARQQEAMATGATHPVTTVGASALLSQALSTQVSGRIQRLFGVSRIKIDPNAGGVGTTGGARITVEQQVTPDLTLTYVTNTSSSQQRIIQLEWAVTDKLSILGARDQNGIFAMEVRFRQRLK